MGNESLNIILFSGTADKFIPVGNLALTAANMGVPVNIFVTGWGTMAFRKDGYKQVTRVSKEFEDMAPALMQGMQEMKAPSWHEMLKSAKEIGDLKIYVCSTTAQAMKIDLENDLDPLVDEVVGAAAFMQISAGGQVIFI